MRDNTFDVGRRTLLTGAALAAAASMTRAQTQPEPDTRLTDVPLGSGATITVERRDDIVLIGLNRPFIQNRLDPPTRARLAEVSYQYEHDSSLRVAVLFGHGDHFSRGIDVDASQSALIAGRRTVTGSNVIDLLGKSLPHRTKPVVVVVHGDTWNLGHELYLAGDVRVAAANTNFGQDENTHGRFPGGGATVRFVREAGWGNAMRYMLTGDHWNADESYRMGITQQIAPTPQATLAAGVAIARKIAACAPLSIKATLASAHQMIDPVEADALSKLDAQYAALYRTEDFLEGRRAEAEGRPPKYQGR
ncbi:MAG TPA: enoyl-CoA hydratase-related protein [Vicinamibacterales bacterium]|jgi:enoyl-CoA hydratase|nr:enoyl-CoA hydratase-related protein [Vicinamibacterales bacterium]